MAGFSFGDGSSVEGFKIELEPPAVTQADVDFPSTLGPPPSNAGLVESATNSSLNTLQSIDNLVGIETQIRMLRPRV